MMQRILLLPLLLLLNRLCRGHLNGSGFGIVFIIICSCFMVGVLMVRKVAEIRREKDEKK